MTSRRELLFGLGAGALGILTAQLERRIFSPARVVARSSAPTILTVEKSYNAFYLHDGEPYDLPSVSWREYLLRQTCSGSLDEAVEEYTLDHGPPPEDLDSLVEDEELILAVTSRFDTSSGGAYASLYDLDLGPRTDEDGVAPHFVEFIDGDCPGNDYLGVRVPDIESLALLQRRLDELQSGILLARG